VGKRLFERGLQFGYDEIERARNYPDTPEGQIEHFLTRQQKLLEDQWRAAWQVLPFTTLKVLHGFQVLSIIHGGGIFPAPLAEVAIHAGVEIKTVSRHRHNLVADGWLAKVWESNGGGKASTYRLKIPSVKVRQEQHATCVHSSPQVLGGCCTNVAPFW
jgi:hypothetical protein